MDAQDPDRRWMLDAEHYALVQDEIAQSTPRVFVMCEFERDEDGQLTAGQVFAWGLKFADHAEVVNSDRGFYGTFGSLNDAFDLLFCGPEEIRLAWLGAPGTMMAITVEPGRLSPHLS